MRIQPDTEAKVPINRDKAQTTEDIVRPLAERTILCSECQGTGERELIGQGGTKNPSPYTTIGACPRTIPDPRFEALRTGDYVDRLNHFRGIDASAGALLRTIQACGIKIILTLQPVRDPPYPHFPREMWRAVWPKGRYNAPTDHTFAPTPEEALARALMMTGGESPHNA